MSCACCLAIFLAFLVSVVSLILFKSYLWPTKYVGDLANKFVLITGCDTGFGRAIAVKLDRLGLHVFATCLTEKGAASLKSECSSKLKTLIMDVTNSENIQKVYETVKQELPRNTGLWGLVNNAGTATMLPIEWMPLTGFKRMADVNLWGLVEVTKTFLPLIKRARGRVVNISSIRGLIAFEHSAPYAITKYGIEAFSDALRREMDPWGVGVSLVEPGGFNTPINLNNFQENQARQYWREMSDELKAEYPEDYMKQQTSTKWKIFGFSEDLSEVTDPITDALLSCSPRPRYLAGRDVRLLFAWVAYLPTNLQDWLLTKIII